MLFSSLLFLFLFLPIVLLIYRILRNEFRNVFLLLVSLFFYAWGEGELVLIMIASIFFNYVIGNVISYFETKKGFKKLALTLGVVLNLSMLIYYKYINFIFDNVNSVFSNLNLQIDDITLPIGISFFTFQSLSYLIDVYRKTVPSQKKIFDLGLYISLFPQLIAGPIVRCEDIHKEITVNNELFKEGVLKFIRGLSKKVVSHKLCKF
jgi:alginate O-acetyltransferase complex protein AlgI